MTNIVILVGNVGVDPESRTSQSGTSITNFSVATSRRYRNDAGDLVEQTEWHRITAFNGLGKTVAQYVKKGMKVSVQGRLHYSKWTDQTGQTRYGVDIYASEVEFLSKAPASTAGGSASPEDDEVPF